MYCATNAKVGGDGAPIPQLAARFVSFCNGDGKNKQVIPYSNRWLQKYYKDEFTKRVCAARASARHGGRWCQNGFSRPRRAGTQPHLTHLVWPVTTLSHCFKRASVGQTPSVSLV
ncbi:hypothetical protein Y032_0264g631 [Ancylostoma ceylanicum]|uniref:Uncharacterized protein n=1 Tax=Ancylostoma ceylanicum TaxID=53326 RepID=A0A016SAS1_9BILA|nr:hypothetical protein Y032_0264g631 [Ancylostoma ceylanicum]